MGGREKNTAYFLRLGKKRQTFNRIDSLNANRDPINTEQDICISARILLFQSL